MASVDRSARRAHKGGAKAVEMHARPRSGKAVPGWEMESTQALWGRHD